MGKGRKEEKIKNDCGATISLYPAKSDDIITFALATVCDGNQKLFMTAVHWFYNNKNQVLLCQKKKKKKKKKKKNKKKKNV
jgi:hypothetical protein